MSQRRCSFCQQQFAPSRFHPEQEACSAPACQRQRRHQNRKHKLVSDPEYRRTCRESARKWRARHPDYWPQYRTAKPASVERNRTQQQQRDRRRRLADLANNNSALDLKSSAAEIWWVAPAPALLPDLANNNLASAQVFILPSRSRHQPPAAASCKQQLSGVSAGLA
jgi:hypothetical protein